MVTSVVQLKERIEALSQEITDLVEASLPETGNTAEGCQKVALRQAIFGLDAAIGDLEPFDAVPVYISQDIHFVLLRQAKLEFNANPEQNVYTFELDCSGETFNGIGCGQTVDEIEASAGRYAALIGQLPVTAVVGSVECIHRVTGEA